MTTDPTARVAAVVARMTFMPDTTMVVSGGHLVLSRNRPELPGGTVRRFYWRKPLPVELLTLAGRPSTPDDVLTRAVARFVWTGWTLEAAHEVAEWLLVDGRHVVDPHPGGSKTAGAGVGDVEVRVAFPEPVWP